MRKNNIPTVKDDLTQLKDILSRFEDMRCFNCNGWPTNIPWGFGTCSNIMSPCEGKSVSESFFCANFKKRITT